MHAKEIPFDHVPYVLELDKAYEYPDYLEAMVRKNPYKKRKIES